QLIFFAPLLFGIALLFKHRLKLSQKNILIAFAAFAIVIGGWVGYVHYRTGSFSSVQGDRADTGLYIRANRIMLGYTGQLKYLYDWNKRIADGGDQTSFLDQNEWH